jgi:hypothetical protein
MVLCVAGLILATVWRSPAYPQLLRFGDDVEYLLTAQSFVRHGSPEYQPGDDADVLASLPKSWRGSASLKYQPRPSGYFPDRTGALYSWHFFTYSAAVAPLKAALDPHGLGWRAFHFLNIVAFCAALLSLLQLRREPRLWLVLLPLAFLTPALWFIPLAHTEAFVFSLGLAATACWLSGRRILAILLNSIAATQFQPLAILTFYFVGATLWRYRDQSSLHDALRRRWPAILACFGCAAVVFLPSAFYFLHYGTGSLVTREGLADSRLASLEKLASLFFDLNTGLAIYAPAVLLLFGWSLYAALREAISRRSVAPLVLPAAIVAAMYATTTARIWNYHTQGIARYALYCTPALLLAIGVQLRAASPIGRFVPALAAVGLGLQLAVHHRLGWFGYAGNNNLHHNAVALYVMDRWPALYAPPPEIFCSRTLHRRCWIDLESGQVAREFLPALYLDDHWMPIKGLVSPCDLGAMLQSPLLTPKQRERAQALMRRCERTGDRTPVYLNFR